MFARAKFWGIAVAICCVAFGQMTTQSSAITAEISKKCNKLAAEAYPARQIRNPAERVKDARAREQYYKKCIENAGNVDDTANGKK